MAFDIIMKSFTEALTNEFNIREEITYKKGYAQGFKDGETKKCEHCECTSAYVEEDTNKESDDFLDGYFTALMEVEDTIEVLLEMSPGERKKLFGSAYINEILEDYTLLSIVETIMKYKEKEDDEEEDDTAEFVKALLESGDIDKDTKEAILNLLKVSDAKVIKVK